MGEIVLKINNKDIKKPTNIKIDLNPITEGARNLAGSMSGLKGVTNKVKITLTYAVIREADLKGILAETWDKFVAGNTIICSVTFPYFGAVVTKQMYFSPTSVTINPIYKKEEIYEDFVLSLIEV